MNISIIPDSIAEGSKTFSGVLATRAPRVTLNPATTVITIIDDEIGKCIGFGICHGFYVFYSYNPMSNITLCCDSMPDHIIL